MSDKITQIPAVSTLEAGDLFVVVDDPAGSPVTKKLTFSDLVAAVTDSILSGGTGRTVTVQAINPTTGAVESLEFAGGMLKS